MGRKILVAARSQGQEGQSKRSRKKSSEKSKGARWAKGHSCVSNPKTMKHREQVSSTFLHPFAGNSLLTVNNVTQYRGANVGEESDDDTVLSSDVASLTISDNPLSVLTCASSVRSMASGWSQVSHNALEKFFRKFSDDIVTHKDMLSILGAVSEVIGENGGKKNETEFFATFMSLLATCPPDQYQPVMTLICIVVGRVSPAVLKLRIGGIYPKIGTVLSFAIENDDELLIRTTIEAFVKLLKIQDSFNLEEEKLLEGVIYSTLKCALHDKPRVRRKVRQSIKSLITCYNDKKNHNVIPKLVIGWVLDQLSCYPMCESKVVANALTLLTSCWSCIQRISNTGAKRLYEGVLRVMSSGDSAIMKIGLSYFAIVFQNNTVVMDSDPGDTLTGKLLVALWELQPDWRNIDTFMIWLSCLLLATVRAQQNSSQESLQYLPMLFEKISPIFLTNYGKKIMRILKEYLPHVINTDIKPKILDACFQNLAKSYLIVPPNSNVLQATECVLEALTPQNFTTSAKEVFLQLTALVQSPGVNSVLGKFVKAFGIEHLWLSCEQPLRWSVILPLIHENLSDSNILFWKKEILTQIGRMGSPKSVWTSLIGFCRNPKDPENFPAELIGKVISEKTELRLCTLAALRQFVDWAQCKTIAVKYTKNYLPLLFNLYVQEKASKSNPGHADAIGVTIQKYLGLCEEPFINELLGKAFQKLETAEKDTDPIFDLIAFLSFNLRDKNLQAKVLNLVTDRFKYPDDRKRIYRIMKFLAKSQHITKENRDLVYNMLTTSKGETSTNAAAIRLECINVITEKNPSWLKNFLSEVILNLISANSKAKRCASRFVVNYCTFLKMEGKSIEEVLDIVLPVLQSSSTLLISSTTYFIHLMYKELKPPCPNFEILNACITNLRKFEDPIVWKYCLAYINLCLSLYKGQLGILATSIGVIAGESKYPRKEINKILARMIKVFGSAGLKAVLPNADEPKMRSRVKNLCKKLKKLKEEKTKGPVSKDDDESDADEEDEFGQLKSETGPMVIKEGLVDFLNPREITQALVSEINPTTEDVEFKETDDGKLIIGNLDDNDEDDKDSIDSDMDDYSNAARQSRKRKAPASIASSKKSARSSKPSASSKPRNKKMQGSGNRSSKSFVVSSTKRKKNSSNRSVKSRPSTVRFK